MIVFWFGVVALGAYRLGYIITQEEGPFGLTERFRNLFVADNWLGRGVRCFLCVSFWMALLLSLLIPASLTEHVLLWFGSAGLAVILDKYWKR